MARLEVDLAGAGGTDVGLPLELDAVRLERGGERLLGELSLRLTAGARTLVLGANGAGKTSLLRLCHGLVEPTAGRISWGGLAPARARAQQAMVFQRPMVLRRSVAANVDYPLRLQGLERDVRRRRIAESLECTGLGALSRRRATGLSTGERQRLALARAWAVHPPVLLLDEPTANLDPASARAVEAIIQSFHRSGVKIIMTTHDLGQARRLADEIVFLAAGRLLERAPAAEFFERPASPEARRYLRGEMP